ncbi:MAG: 4'-phosphopantetheinyl transferase, partial [Crocinitomicaceae bacterium]
MKIFQNQLEFKRESGSFTAILCGVTGNLETLDAEMGNYLSKNEIEVAMKFGGKKRRLTYLLGRFAAKEALSSLLGSASKTDIEVRAGIFGQPVVVYDGKKQIAVNIA